MSKARALADLTLSGGNSVASMSNVGDVQIASLGNNQFLVWDTTAGRWKNTGLKGSHFPGRSSTSELSERRAIKTACGIAHALTDYALAGTVEWTQAWNDAVAAVGPSSDRRLFIPAGSYNIANALTLAYPIVVYGESMSTSVIQPTHAGTGILVTGQFGTGGALKDLSIAWNTGGGTSVAQLILYATQNAGTPTSHYSPDFFELHNLNLTGFNGSKSQYNLILNGADRYQSVGGTVQQGLRNIVVNRIEAFNATAASIDVRQGRVVHLSNLGIYGSSGVGGMIIQGGLGGTLSYDVKIINGTINGTTAITQCDGTKLIGVTTTVSLGSGVTNYEKVA